MAALYPNTSGSLQNFVVYTELLFEEAFSEQELTAQGTLLMSGCSLPQPTLRRPLPSAPLPRGL